MLLLILLFVYALIKFTWSVRQFNFVTILVGSLSPKEQVNDDDRRAAHSAAGILNSRVRTSDRACARTISRLQFSCGSCNR